jgi:hypothetical protein
MGVATCGWFRGRKLDRVDPVSSVSRFSFLFQNEDAEMKLRFTMVAVLVLCGIGLWVRGGASPAMAVAAADSMQQTVSESDYKYVGNKKCKSCHLDVHKSWAKTRMGTAFETLKPGHAKEAKTQFGFDAAKDYTSDAKCLPCHTTGYGKPGGYVIPAADDKRAARKMKRVLPRTRQRLCQDLHGDRQDAAKVHARRALFGGPAQGREGHVPDVPQRQEPDDQRG